MRKTKLTPPAVMGLDLAIEGFLNRYKGQITPADVGTILFVAARIAAFYAIEEGRRAALPDEAVYPTLYAKETITTQTSLTPSLRLELARLLDGLAWRAGHQRARLPVDPKTGFVHIKTGMVFL